MKFGITFSRKVRAPQAYEMLEIGLYLEVDSSEKTMIEAYTEVRGMVNMWITEELARLTPEPSAPIRRINPIE